MRIKGSSVFWAVLINFIFLMGSLVSPREGDSYIVWFDYPESNLPNIQNALPSTNAYSPWDEWMMSRWNLYANIFSVYPTRQTQGFRNAQNDQVDPFLDDTGFNAYFSMSEGWRGASAICYRESIASHTDIAYNTAIPWITSYTETGQLFQGTALHELGHSIGLHHNFNDMSVMNYNQPKQIDDHLMPDDVRYIYDRFPNLAKTVTDMGVWPFYSSGYQKYGSATATPSTVNSGDAIRVDGIYVGNLRNGEQCCSKLRFFLSTDTAITLDDTLIGELSFGAFPPATGEKYDNILLTIPPSVTTGQYYVGMIVFADGVNQDPISYNNTAYLTLKIQVNNPVIPGVKGDFNNDAKTDILWRNPTTGQNYVWLMNGLTLSSSLPILTQPGPWEIVGTGDFNGDGKTDILWRNQTTGQNYVWLMNGLALNASLPLLSQPGFWEIVGTGDFNADGKTDILWRNQTTGQNYVWVMDGTALNSSLPIMTQAPPWQIVGTGDFNNDGKVDILWRNPTTGQNYVWLMNGLLLNSSLPLLSQPGPWEIVGTGDFNGDAKTDILWRNPTTGQNYVWLMNGLVLNASLPLLSQPGPWEIVGPK